jgi:hypothetical protein
MIFDFGFWIFDFGLRFHKVSIKKSEGISPLVQQVVSILRHSKIENPKLF